MRWTPRWTFNDPGGKAAGATDVQLGTAAVREPAAWALMNMGFGMAGAMIRRRKQALA